MTPGEYSQQDAIALAQLVRTKAIKPQELLALALAGVEALDNPQNGTQRLGAVVYRAEVVAGERLAALQRPDNPANQGPFVGVPYLLKDLACAAKGLPLTNGSRFVADTAPTFDCEMVKRHIDAGLIPIGRSAAPEWGLLPFTETRAHGNTRTPWKEGHTAGGSSGGAGAAVGSGIVPLAHGGDGAGSLRIPASCCGVFGLKPSRGRTPLGPERSEAWHGMALEHGITRSVRDSAALLDATCALEPGAPYCAPPPRGSFLEACTQAPGRLRIATSTRPMFPTEVHPDCLAAQNDAMGLLEDLGHEIVPVKLPGSQEEMLRDFFAFVCGNVASELALAQEILGRVPKRHELESATWLMALRGRQMSAPFFNRTRERLQKWSRDFVASWADCDVLLTPTLSAPPVPFGVLVPQGLDALLQEVIVRGHLEVLLRVPGVIGALEKKSAVVLGFIPFTPMANISGQPAMSVPLFWNDQGLPVGSHLVGRYGDEETLFRLAGQLEQARPWRDRTPSTHLSRL